MAGLKAIAKGLFAGGLLAGGANAVGVNSKFQYDEESGVISLVQDPTLRLNVAGGEINNGDKVVLYPCAAHSHELFQLDGGVISLQHSPGMCLNAAGGVAAGAKIITWHCAGEADEVDHEKFVLTEDGRIKLQKHDDFCINVEGGAMHQGGQLILYPCSKEADAPNEVFEYEDGLIRLKAHPELHFNVKGGELGVSNDVVLWSCQPGTHEIFEFIGGRLRMRHKPDLCINAEEGVGGGHSLIAWPCEKEAVAPNEGFVYDDARKVIHSTHDTNMGFNVKEGAMQAGGSVILWPLDQEEL